MNKKPLTVKEQSRVNKVFLDAGFLYLPWEKNQQQLKDAYQPANKIIIPESVLNSIENPNMREVLTSLVRKVEGFKGAFWDPEQNTSEKLSEKAAQILIACAQRGAKPDSVRKLTRRERKALKY